MNKVILHISDLHVSLDKVLGGQSIVPNSYLTTKSDMGECTQFIDKFIKTVSEEVKTAEIYLLVTGDITNAAEKKEFAFALIYLKRIIEKLNIITDRILLIPGDHDLNRRAITNLHDINDNPTAAQVNAAKFENFTEFYEKLINRKFDPNKIIFDKIIFANKILLLGINSSINIDLVQKEGSVPLLEFEKELNEIEEVKTLKTIACVHHNVTSAYENKNDGQWENKSRQHFITKLNEKTIGHIFCGNEHTCSAKTVPYAQLFNIDSGTLTSINSDATFKIYDLKDGEDIILENHIYALQKTGLRDNNYEWDKRQNSKFQQPDEFILFRKSPPELESEIVEITGKSRSKKAKKTTIKAETTKKKLTAKPVTERVFYYSPEYTDVLYDKIKELKVFHSGHYHWSETSRAHNWIDVAN